jgi:outer membrane protein, heavy metal efflux system
MNKMRFALLLISLLVFKPDVRTQQVVAVNDLLNSALVNHPSVKMSELYILQSRQQKSMAWNIPNPDLMVESPTGTFYTLGIIQSIEFPSVYIQQARIAGQETMITEMQQKLTILELRYLVYSYYLRIQLADMQRKFAIEQDSITALIEDAVTKERTAGNIDELQLTFATVQRGETMLRKMEMESDYASLKKQLQLITGYKSDFTTAPMQKMADTVFAVLLNDSSFLFRNPSYILQELELEMAETEISLAKNKALPGISFGYLNQGEATTPTFYRFRAGITIPLWFWQYSAAIKYSKMGKDLAQQKLMLTLQELSVEMTQAKNDFFKYANALKYFEQTGLNSITNLRSQAARMFFAGQQEMILIRSPIAIFKHCTITTSLSLH